MKNFQMLDIDLINIRDSFILSNFSRVILQRINFKYQEENLNYIPIQIYNNQLVVIEEIFIENINFNLQAIFDIQNNTSVIINKIIISNSTLLTAFQVFNCDSVDISNIKIVNSTYIQIFQIRRTDHLNLQNSSVTNLTHSTILDSQGSHKTIIDNM